MREITSVEIHVLVDELRERIEGGFVRKFYEIGNGAFRFQFYSSASGNTTVYCKLLFAFNETRFAEAAEEPTAFAMGMRKHIEGAAVTGIAQHGTDRIIILGLSSKSGRRSLIIEMFGKGNMVLVDGNGTIEQCYLAVSFRDRKIAPRAQYNFPKSTATVAWNSGESEVIGAVREAMGKRKAMAELSKRINVGPLYLEDVFNRAGIDPKGEISSEAEAAALAREFIAFLRRAEAPRPRTYATDGVCDYAIMPIRKYEGMKAVEKGYASLSALLDDVYAVERVSIADGSRARKLEALSANIRKQEELALQLKRDSEGYMSAGHSILEHMSVVNGVISYMKSNRRATLGELKAAFPNIKITGLDLKEKRVLISLGE